MVCVYTRSCDSCGIEIETDESGEPSLCDDCLNEEVCDCCGMPGDIGLNGFCSVCSDDDWDES